ncbi:MAG: cytochrome C assembly protein [Sulfobacillus acidophilus]|uniref:Heme exporter protein C n=1 Tax=Sulfobacillus acidophilus TaxID=53633 RepID=A0A2T2WPM7_9FIRM|nr:MAG: cytochrome C assembly protein [Sulfobacillus acidophilus]
MILALYLNFLGAPDDAVLGPSQRIFYIHMGAAVTAAVAFTVTFAASLAYLATRRQRWDVLAAASAEVGIVFTAMVLVTGILWGRVAWGVWWTWDPRLTTTLMLWALYGGYLIVRDAVDNSDRRARISAVLALVAYVDVPLDYMTIRWWNSVHPLVITNHGLAVAPSMAVAMFMSMAAMLGVYGVWLALRMRLMAVELGIEEAKAVWQNRGI